MQLFPGVLMAPRLQAPLTLLERSLRVAFRSVRTRKAGGERIVEFEAWGRFLRDKAGRARTEYYNPGTRPEEADPVVAILWNPLMRRITTISFPERIFEHSKGPPLFPDEHEWRPAPAIDGVGFLSKLSDRQQIIHGLNCKHVELVPVPSMVPVPSETMLSAAKNEAWVAFDWGLVVSDVAESDDLEVLWEVVTVDRTEPPESAFSVPAGFVERNVTP